MRIYLFLVMTIVIISACDNRNSAQRRSPASPVGGGLQFDDQFAGGAINNNSLLRVYSRIASTTANGELADVVLSYSIDPNVAPSLEHDAYVRFDYMLDDQVPEQLARQKVNTELAGTVEFTVPTGFHNANILASLHGLEPGVIDDTATLVALTPAIPRYESSDLEGIGAAHMSLVDRSYESELVDGRRIHRFAVKVTDPTARLVYPAGDKPDDFDYSISGLEQHASKHFQMQENGINDVESPVSVDFERHKLAVYMVIDKSKSIVESRQAHNVADAVSRSVIALSDNADFDYRWFSQTVARVTSLRDLQFDTDDESGTALYYALDRTLADIENFGSIDQDKIIILFTDGMDLSSRNHYNDNFIDNNQVFEYARQRVAQVRQSQFDTLGRQLKVYTMGFYPEGEGINAPAEIRKLDEIAEAGGTVSSYNTVSSKSIIDAFKSVVQNIQGVYYLQYSSQQTANDNLLQLTLNIDGHQPVTIDLPGNHRN